MDNAVQVTIHPTEIIKAVKRMKKKEREAFVEDLLAATSPEYLQSIREGRAEYRSGKTHAHDEVFGK